MKLKAYKYDRWIQRIYRLKNLVSIGRTRPPALWRRQGCYEMIEIQSRIDNQCGRYYRIDDWIYEDLDEQPLAVAERCTLQ